MKFNVELKESLFSKYTPIHFVIHSSYIDIRKYFIIIGHPKYSNKSFNI